MSARQESERAALKARVLALIDASADGARRDGERDALLADLHDYQLRWLPPYANFCAQGRAVFGSRADPRASTRALPCDAFRFARISSRSPEHDVRRFRSSGTTQDTRSEHAFADLSLYDRAAQVSARHMLFPEGERMQLLTFAPRADELPDSSLSYMLARFEAWFGAGPSDYVWPIDAARAELLCAELTQVQQRGRPLALLGTSFAFVHALDLLGTHHFTLPRGSRIMQTGGFKGRSRELSPSELRAALSARFGVPEALIVAEYGMTELSSQLYAAGQAVEQ